MEAEPETCLAQSLDSLTISKELDPASLTTNTAAENSIPDIDELATFISDYDERATKSRLLIVSQYQDLELDDESLSTPFIESSESDHNQIDSGSPSARTPSPPGTTSPSLLMPLGLSEEGSLWYHCKGKEVVVLPSHFLVQPKSSDMVNLEHVAAQIIRDSKYLTLERASLLARVGEFTIDRSDLGHVVHQALPDILWAAVDAVNAEPASWSCNAVLTMLSRSLQATTIEDMLDAIASLEDMDGVILTIERIIPPDKIFEPQKNSDPGFPLVFIVVGCLLAFAYARYRPAVSTTLLDRSLSNFDLAVGLMPQIPFKKVRDSLLLVRQSAQRVQALFQRLEQEIDPHPPGNTCDTCYDLMPIDGVHDSKFPLHRMEFEAVLQSANSGCRACTLLRNSVASMYAQLGFAWDDIQTISYKNITMGPQWRGKEEDPWTFESVTCGSEKPLELEITTHYLGDKETAVTRSLELYVLQGSARPWPIVGTGTHISCHPDSDESWQKVDSWLQNCKQTHKKCLLPDEAPLPTRILDVGAEGINPQLHISVHGERAKYAALSHCWGEIIPLRTTKDMIDQYIKGIKVSELPASFRDAVLICRRLGIQYLWVDSLCIVQDDDDDWAIESAKMCDIYSNAFFTIAAAAAKDSSDGCMMDRPLGGFRSFTTVTTGETVEEVEVFVRSWASCRVWYKAIGDGPSGIAQYPLETRAWTLQEQLLSRRILRFTKHELVWQCRETTLCECTPGCMAYKGAPRLLRPTRPDDKEWPLSDHRSYLLTWVDVLDSFTNRSITRESDRLPALSGIAAALSNANSITYLGGMWKEVLHRSLLWEVGGTGSTRSSVYCAPTWSWASVIGKIDTHTLLTSNQLDTTTVLSVDYTLATKNPFGRLSKASITLKGILVHAKLIPPLEPENIRDYKKSAFTLEFDSELAFVFGEGQIRSATMNPDIRTSSNHALELDPLRVRNPFLIVGARPGEKGFSILSGLLMAEHVKAPDTGETIYRRVGRGDVWLQDEGISWSGKMDDGLAVVAASQLIERGFGATVTIV